MRPVKVGKFQPKIETAVCGLQSAHPFWHDLFADAITGNDRYFLGAHQEDLFLVYAWLH
jgi:hypothetical protein